MLEFIAVMTITDLQNQIAHGLSPAGLVDDFLVRVAAWDDPALFIHLPGKEELLAMAEAAFALPGERPLRGIPFVVKDNIDVAGWPTTAACPGFSRVAGKDATVVRLLREAGAFPVAKANMDQFATGLVGTRSPYGTPQNAHAPGYLPGGSSSGSASAVAAGLVPFSLGTDTAGSGRVPAAFQELVGWKPTRGLVSIGGAVPACRSLDCVSVFANHAADAAAVAAVIGKFDRDDPFSRTVSAKPGWGKSFRFGVPAVLDFAGDPDTPGLFAQAVEKMKALGGEVVSVDLTPFTEAAKLLYEGPWVAERWAAVGEFVGANPEEVFPVTRKILEDSRGWDAVAAYQASYQLRAFARQAEAVWQSVDLLLLPTTPCLYTVEQVMSEPFTTNATLGRYTNFMNLLDLAAVAVPAGRARDGLAPWGVTLAAPAGADAALLALAGRWTGEERPPAAPVPRRIPLLVCGAHLEGLALHHQLANRGAILRDRTVTAPCYRMFAMPPTGKLPARPALVRDDSGGAHIDVEIWELEPAAFAEFVAAIPAPLGIGKVTIASGEEVPGFIAEPRAIEGAEEITGFGGWRAWGARGQ